MSITSSATPWSPHVTNRWAIAASEMARNDSIGEGGLSSRATMRPTRSFIARYLRDVGRFPNRGQERLQIRLGPKRRPRLLHRFDALAICDKVIHVVGVPGNRAGP